MTAFELRPHQRKAVDELGNGKILCGDVGLGKTLTSLAYYVENESPRDVYVITTAKKRDSRDWEKDASQLHVYPEDRAKHGLLTVDSWNNIEKYLDVRDAFFIFDEQRLVGNGKWVKSFLQIAKDNRWILLSATPGDNWLDYIPVFLANGFYRNRTEFKREHVIYNHHAKFPKVDRYVNVSKLVRFKNSLLVDMPYERHTTRHIKRVPTSYDPDLYEKVVKHRWHVYEERPLRDVAELFSVARKVVNSDASRLERLRDLLDRHPRVIVFYNFDYELEMLRTLVGLHTSMTTLKSAETLGVNSCRPGGTGADPGKLSSHTQSTEVPAISAHAEERSEKCLSNTITKSATSRGATDSETTACICPPTTSTARTVNPHRCPRNPQSERSSTPSQSNRNPDRAGGPEAPLHKSQEACGRCSKPTKTEKSNTGTTSVLPTADVCIDAQSGRQPVTIAEWNGHKHEPVPETDRWVYLVQYTAGSEGWNCITTNAVAFFSLTYSYKAWYQAHGRIDRLNTLYTDLYYYHLMSNSSIDKAIFDSLTEKKSFNEANFVKKHGFST